MNWFATVIFAILEVALRSLRNAYTFVSNSRKIGSTLVGLGKMAKPRTRPCLAVALSIVLITCFTSLVTTVHASPANPGHPASSISAGTFESGNYVFPNNLTINSFLIVNTDTLYVDSISGKIGIGTETPYQELDVVGNINATGTINSTTDLCIQGGKCLSNMGVGTGDVTDVLAGWGITVTNSAGPQPRVNLSSTSAGNGLGYSQGILSVKTGDGIEISSDTVVLNQSCSDGEILKWESTGSYWYCAADENSGGSVSGTGTNHRLAYWTGTGTINDLSAGNSGDVLESRGSGADPAWIAKSSLAGTHTHDASNITSGTLSTGRYSAYSDLSAEGYLNNDNANDLLTRSQADTRFINDGGNEVGSNDISTGAVGSDELASGAVTAAGTELDSSVAGNGLGLSSGALYVKTGNGIEISSDTVVLNQSCSDGQILKWETTGSYWYCAADTGGTGGDYPGDVWVNESGDTMTGNLNMNSNLITNIGNGGTDFTAGGGLTLAADLTVNGGDVSINNNNGGVNFNDASAFWLKTATNWGIYWNTTANTIEFTGSGTDRANIDLDNGNMQLDGNLTVSGTKISSGGDVIIQLG